MGRKYYCDFCDRSFQDNLDAKKKHFAGHLHNANKKKYYDQFMTAQEQLERATSKKPCNRFRTQGFCNFGDDCLYSHLTFEALKDLQYQAEVERQNQEQLTVNEANGKLSATTEFLSEFCDQLTRKTSDVSAIKDQIENYQKMDPRFRNFILPPSLVPFGVDDLLYADFNHWS